MAVKNAVAKNWKLIPGADGRRRSFDPYGLTGNGIAEVELAQPEIRVLVQRVENEARQMDWTSRETREVLIHALKSRLGSADQQIELLLQAELAITGQDVEDGAIVTASAIPWHAIYAEVRKDPRFLEHFARHPRQFEEFIAGAYVAAGWDEVILTPRSGDRGRDVIAIKLGFGSVRFLEQTKAYSPGHLVTHDDVRAMLGVLQTDQNSSKGLITTTSDFQRNVRTSDKFHRLMPHRLELKNGPELVRWLDEIGK